MHCIDTLNQAPISLHQWFISDFKFLSNEEEGVFILMEGRLVIRDVHTELDIQPGEFIFARRGNYIVSTGGCESRLLWVPLPVPLLQDFSKRVSSFLSGVGRCESHGINMLSFARTPLLVDCIEGLKVLLKHEHPPALALLRIEELLTLFALSPQGPTLLSVMRQQGCRQVERLQEFMEAHYLKEWHLSDFSREFGMCLTTFKDFFVSVYGVTPRAWISERRVLYSHHLLISSEMSLVEIAMESGFSSQSYFSQSYRRRFGCTPSQARHGMACSSEGGAA